MKYCPACGQNYPDNDRHCPNDHHLLSLPDPYHLVGRTLMEKYRIEALVGVGGMGAVYSAHHLVLNRRVAFKILLPHLTLGNQDMLALFQREAELAGQLDHENIVGIKDAGLTPDGIAYIVMEWLDGHTLDVELLTKRKLSLDRTSMILRQISAALDHAHEKHIIHRDLKPTNIMIVSRQDRREQVKVVDFGIAKAVSEATSSLISSLIGTPHYASPEQFVLGGRIDGRSDIYSLGVLVFQMLSGDLPFNAQSPQELLRMQKTESPPSVRERRAEVPLAIDQLLFRMLAKNPDDRPQTAREASAIFEHVLKVGMGRLSTHDDINSPTVKESHPSTQGQDAIRATDGESDDAGISERTTIKVLQRVHESPKTVPPDVEPPKIDPVQVPTSGGRKLKLLAISAALSLAIIIAVAWLYSGKILSLLSTEMVLPAASPTPVPRTELMSYYLEISSDKCKTFTRGSGDESLEAGQGFKLHFKARESGYLYIITQNKSEAPATFLTAQSDPKTGVRTNFVKAGAEFAFPSGEGGVLCYGVTNVPIMALTIIFSPTQLVSPGFLVSSAHTLNSAEQLELKQWQQQYANSTLRTTPDSNRQESQVTIERDPGVAARPVIFDLLIKRR